MLYFRVQLPYEPNVSAEETDVGENSDSGCTRTSRRLTTEVHVYIHGVNDGLMQTQGKQDADKLTVECSLPNAMSLVR